MRTLVPHRTGHSRSIFDGIDHIFDSFFTEQPPAARSRAPAVDIREEDKAYVLQAEFPGVAEKDLKVSINDNVVTISAGADEKDEHKSGGYLVRERRRASFTRSFVLPGDADDGAVGATFKDGLLTLHVPTNKASKAREIPIKAG